MKFFEINYFAKHVEFWHLPCSDCLCARCHLPDNGASYWTGLWRPNNSLLPNDSVFQSPCSPKLEVIITLRKKDYENMRVMSSVCACWRAGLSLWNHIYCVKKLIKIFISILVGMMVSAECIKYHQRMVWQKTMTYILDAISKQGNLKIIFRYM